LCGYGLACNALDKIKVPDKTNNNIPLLVTVESLTLLFDINKVTSKLLIDMYSK
jgi:hypothetical protein